MLAAKTVRIWYRTHKWTSLICTATSATTAANAAGDHACVACGSTSNERTLAAGAATTSAPKRDIDLTGIAAAAACAAL